MELKSNQNEYKIVEIRKVAVYVVMVVIAWNGEKK